MRLPIPRDLCADGRSDSQRSCGTTKRALEKAHKPGLKVDLHAQDATELRRAWPVVALVRDAFEAVLLDEAGEARARASP